MNSELIKLALSQQGDGSQQLRSPTTQTQNESAILKLKGLPYDTSKEQILEFFQGFDVKNVEFVFEPDGRPSGLAFAEFSAREEAIRAMAKNGEYLGERYVKLLLVPRQEMEEQVKLGTIAIPGGAARARAGLLRRRAQRLPLHPGVHGAGDVLMNVLPTASPLMSHHTFSPAHMAYSAPMQVRDVFPENYIFLQPTPHMQGHVAKAMPHQMQVPLQAHMIPQPQMIPQAHMQQRIRVPIPSQMSHAGMLAPQHQLSVSGIPPSHQMQHTQQLPQSPHMHSRGHHSVMAPHSPTMSPTSASSVDPSGSVTNQKVPNSSFPPGSDGAPPGSTHDVKTLKIRGLPFRVSPQELLNFFWGFDFVPESLCFGKDTLGRPSGEAWLSFTAHQEAVRAVAERNRQYLRNRYLELSLWHG